jgi:hypothetical protein
MLIDVCFMCFGEGDKENIGFCTGRRKQVLPCLQAVEISRKIVAGYGGIYHKRHTDSEE